MTWFLNAVSTHLRGRCIDWGHMEVLAISGSLRAASINSALLRTAACLAPPEIVITLCDVVRTLPLFDPYLKADVPAGVLHLQT